MKLLIIHSYGKENLPNELVEVGKKIIRACNGLPLNLKILRVSFDNLKVEEKKIFLDICCFFGSNVYQEGMLKERVLQIWANNQKNILKHDMESILNTLIYESLIKINNSKIIRVHDQL
uniref:NB-ARC domain-containing protein n=1 Tax=Physcomitrium patens TaxID=3218 RepID=A0A2K1JHK0_PHYPA|nr:hypothetical protein PHYPA_018427 [Physcomitrium patens]